MKQGEGQDLYTTHGEAARLHHTGGRGHELYTTHGEAAPLHHTGGRGQEWGQPRPSVSPLPCVDCSTFETLRRTKTIFAAQNTIKRQL